MIIAACCGVLGLSAFATADTLSLLQEEKAAKDTAPPEEAKEEAKDAKSHWYFAAAAGASWALNADIVDSNGAYFKFNRGGGVNVGFGYAFTKILAVQVHSGILWNQVNSIQNAYPAPGQTFGGGAGNLWQVPVMASLVVSIPLAENLGVGIKGGVGVQWTKFNAYGINRYTGGVWDGTVTWDHNSTAFRYEFGFQFANQISHNVRIGGGAMFSGTTEVNIGAGQFYNTAGVGVASPSNENKLSRLFNISLGFGVNVSF